MANTLENTIGKSVFPFGAADIKAVTGVVMNVHIDNTFTIVQVAGAIASNSTMNFTFAEDLKIGSIVVVTLSTTATETLTFGTGATAKVLTGVAGKTFTNMLIFDGTQLLGISNQQID